MLSGTAGDAAERDGRSYDKRDNRKRSGKPKVKTGCITWIRRIKCDEGRPSCLRCTSTGRKCDGYIERSPSPKGQSPSRRSSTDTSVVRSHRAILPRIVRQISPDIQGTEHERLYFHRFRNEALRGLALHAANVGSLWERLVPRIAHYNDAVRHALIALGSAYELQQRRASSTTISDVFQLEVFTLQQYNMAIQSLRTHLLSPSDDHVGITLLCSLIFTSLETFRQNPETAITHFASGTRVIEQLPNSVLNDIMSTAGSSSGSFDGPISRAELREFISFYQEFELGTRVHGVPARPTLSLRLRDVTQEDDGPWEDYRSLNECHAHFHTWAHHVYARMWETRSRKDDFTFWSQPEQRGSQARLINQGRRVVAMTDRFMSSPFAPDREEDKAGYISGLLDKMHGRGVLLTAQCMPKSYTRRELRHFDPLWREVLTIIEDIINLIEDQNHVPDGRGGTSASTQRGPLITLDSGILIGFHVTLYATGDRDIRRRAMGLLRRIRNKREGLYDATELLKVFEALGADGQGTYADQLLLDDPAGPGLGGLDGPLGLENRLAALSLSEGRKKTPGNT
ncbi:hypothetical protein TruAng_009864 [Truncatella angustata]|nr:hypothetical protein TruAng_009864 [Truncatella angustata]